MPTPTESIQKVLFFNGRRLDRYECSVEFQFYKNGQPFNISDWGLQLHVTSQNGPAVNMQLETFIEGSQNHIFRLLQPTPEEAGLPLIGGKSTAKYFLWLSRQGQVGRKLLARTDLAIEPEPKDKDAYSTGNEDPEVFRIDLDDQNQAITGSLAIGEVDYDILYNQIYLLANSTWARKTVVNWDALLQHPLPTRETIFTVQQTTTLGQKTYPAGLYILFPDGRIEDLISNPYRNATL